MAGTATSSERRFTGKTAVQPTDKLKFRYIATYLVEGLQCPTDRPLLLHSDPEQGKKISLTGHNYDGRHHVATVHTIALKMASLLVGSAAPYDIKEF